MSDIHESQLDLLNDHKAKKAYKNKLKALSNSELLKLQEECRNDNDVDREVELIFVNGELNKRLKAKERVAARDGRKVQKNMLKTTRYSIYVSFLSLIIAGLALLVSYNATNSSARWEKSQLLFLEELKKEAEDMTNKLQLAINENSEKNIQESRSSTKKLISTIESLKHGVLNKSEITKK